MVDLTFSLFQKVKHLLTPEVKQSCNWEVLVLVHGNSLAPFGSRLLTAELKRLPMVECSAELELPSFADTPVLGVGPALGLEKHLVTLWKATDELHRNPPTQLTALLHASARIDAIEEALNETPPSLEEAVASLSARLQTFKQTFESARPAMTFKQYEKLAAGATAALPEIELWPQLCQDVVALSSQLSPAAVGAEGHYENWSNAKVRLLEDFSGKHAAYSMISFLTGVWLKSFKKDFRDASRSRQEAISKICSQRGRPTEVSKMLSSSEFSEAYTLLFDVLTKQHERHLHSKENWVALNTEVSQLSPAGPLVDFFLGPSGVSVVNESVGLWIASLSTKFGLYAAPATLSEAELETLKVLFDPSGSGPYSSFPEAIKAAQNL